MNLLFKNRAMSNFKLSEENMDRATMLEIVKIFCITEIACELLGIIVPWLLQ